MNPVATLLQTPDGTLLIDTIEEGLWNVSHRAGTGRGVSDLLAAAMNRDGGWRTELADIAMMREVTPLAAASVPENGTSRYCPAVVNIYPDNISGHAAEYLRLDTEPEGEGADDTPDKREIPLIAQDQKVPRRSPTGQRDSSSRKVQRSNHGQG